MKKLFARSAMLLPFFGLSIARVDVQSPPSAQPKDELYRTIASLDGEVFDAFNLCDLEKFGSFFTEELEFYHDNGGLTNRVEDHARHQLRPSRPPEVRRTHGPYEAHHRWKGRSGLVSTDRAG